MTQNSETLPHKSEKDMSWEEKARATAFGYAGEGYEWALEQAILSALRSAYAKGLEDAAKEAESWWPMFDFESFPQTDPRRYANPNQIAARIRDMKPDAGRKE